MNVCFTAASFYISVTAEERDASQSEGQVLRDEWWEWPCPRDSLVGVSIQGCEDSGQHRINARTTSRTLSRHWSDVVAHPAIGTTCPQFVTCPVLTPNHRKGETLRQCCFNVGPASETISQNYNNIGSTSCVYCRITENTWSQFPENTDVEPMLF